MPKDNNQKPIPPYEKMKATPIRECHQPMVDLLKASPKIFDGRTAYRLRLERKVFNQKPTKELFLRQGVVDRLIQSLDLLNQKGNEKISYGFIVYETFRQPAVQQAWFEENLQKLLKENPRWTYKQALRQNKRWLSPAQTDPSLPPSPHSTGAAIDLSIVKIVNDIAKELDMGGRYAESKTQSWTNCPNISDKAKANRKLLTKVMSNSGFKNYPGEWWHWSYGDQFWAVYSSKPYAIYNQVRPEHFPASSSCRAQTSLF